MSQNNTGPMLFVNKTLRSDSLSNNRSDRVSRKQINQFVQHTRHLEREHHARIERLNSRSLAHHSHRPTAAVLPETSLSVTLRTPPSTPLVVANSTSRNSSVGNQGFEAEEVSRSSELAHVIPERGTVEPFGVCRVSLDNERYRILQYFILEMFPAISRSDTPAFFTDAVSPGQETVAQMIRDCLTDEMHTYALLTASSARMKFLARASLSQADLPERYADKTMRRLREYLSKNRRVDERLILTIFFLWAIESYRRDWKAVRTHQEMIKHLYTTQLGGFRNLSYQLRKILWFADRFQATATATPPVIEESWETQDISPWVVSRVLRAITASGQQPMGAAFAEYTVTLFSPGFRRLLHEVTVLGCVIQCYWTNIKESYPDPNWVSGRSHTMLDKLLFFKEGRTQKDSTFAAMLQECVRLALITWLAFIGAPKTGVGSSAVAENLKIRVAVDARPLRQHFASLITYRQETGIEDQRHSIDRLFLWIAGLGGVVSELKFNIEWFCQRFQELATKLGIDSWAGFTPVGHSFFWLDRLEAINGFRLTKALERQSMDRKAHSAVLMPKNCKHDLRRD